MDNSTDPSIIPAPTGVPPVSTDAQLSELTSLLTGLDDAARADSRSDSPTHREQQSRIAKIRLGVASSLFTALQAKHAPTAEHSLRVAIGCSAWAIALDMPEQQRELLEIASLLHDIGKVGVPDHILLKPGKLVGEEVILMEQHRQIGHAIMANCCPTQALLDIVEYSSAWFDGTRHGYDRSGTKLPLGSRMIAIVDAFDAMTTDHVYRRAMSRERALAELFSNAGTQFDPTLVRAYGAVLSCDSKEYQSRIAEHWLQPICEQASNRFWGQCVSEGRGTSQPIESGYEDHLFETMTDGVFFVDSRLTIRKWNRAAERITGIAAAGIVDKQWVPELIGLSDEKGKTITGDGCPVFSTMKEGTQSLRRLSLRGRNEDRITIDLHVAALLAADGTSRGATILMHDASSQTTLEERVQSLYERATRDPLTGCANRAEFDRVFSQFVETHLERGLPCSMVICDIDHFKRINDRFGHQAGDEALTTFGGLLRRHARTGDLVARYGGEEFVLLCADCDNATATRRAEDIRRSVAQQPHKSLNGRSITASFGVTEVQGGDTPATFLRRADRALLQAKDNGRNVVVQLGTGITAEDTNRSTPAWLHWFRSKPGERVLERSLITVVPLSVVAEKLRGFIADQNAEIVSVEENRVCLRIDENNTPLTRRWNDRPVPFLIDLAFDHCEVASTGRTGGKMPRTLIHVSMRPKRQRDRRRRDVHHRANKLVVSLRSYLMANEVDNVETTVRDEEIREEFLTDAKAILSKWLSR